MCTFHSHAQQLRATSWLSPSHLDCVAPACPPSSCGPILQRPAARDTQWVPDVLSRGYYRRYYSGRRHTVDIVSLPCRSGPPSCTAACYFPPQAARPRAAGPPPPWCSHRRPPWTPTHRPWLRLRPTASHGKNHRGSVCAGARRDRVSEGAGRRRCAACSRSFHSPSSNINRPQSKSSSIGCKQTARRHTHSARHIARARARASLVSGRPGSVALGNRAARTYLPHVLLATRADLRTRRLRCHGCSPGPCGAWLAPAHTGPRVTLRASLGSRGLPRARPSRYSVPAPTDVFYNKYDHLILIHVQCTGRAQPNSHRP